MPGRKAHWRHIAADPGADGAFDCPAHGRACRRVPVSEHVPDGSLRLFTIPAGLGADDRAPGAPDGAGPAGQLVIRRLPAVQRLRAWWRRRRRRS